MKISVIICTHNARLDYFNRCLGALKAQSLPAAKWDLLIVDNRSDRPVESEIDLSSHTNTRTVWESKLGLTPARLRGIRESGGDLLVFVDDDNVLASDYLERAAGIAEQYPFLGAWSGQCLPKFDVTPPEWTRRYWGSLCIREFDRDIWSNLPLLPETMPCGAGLCVRRQAAMYYLDLYDRGRRSMILDRVGSSLVSGGDNDLAACACDVNLGVGLFSVLKLIHLIPPHRLTENYLCQLVEGIEYSGVIVRAERGVPTPARGLVGKVADQLRVLRYLGPDRRIQRAALRGRTAARRWLVQQSAGPTAHKLFASTTISKPANNSVASYSPKKKFN
jgi:glycosyltransferase involved in cell wall biosynthesis